MIVLSPVEKLILYRKKYKISQKELSGENMSRSHLAMIETGKNSLNEHTAILIVENFNQILRDRGIDESIALANLMETKEMQVEKLKNSFLDKLDDHESLDLTVSEIESYASEYDADTKIMLYKKMGDLFYEKDNPHRATSFYLRIINDLIIKRDPKTLGEISVTLVRIYLQTENYHAAIDLENLIKSEIESFNSKEKTIIYFNLGCIFDSLKKHDDALKYFKKVEILVSNPDQFFDVKNYQALSSADLGNFEKSISIYRSLMLKFKDPVKKLMINDNLLYVAKLEKNDEKIRFYFRKCKKLVNDLLLSNDYYAFSLEQALFSIAEVAYELKKTKDAIKFYSLLCRSITDRNIDIKFKSIQRLLLISTKKDLLSIHNLENLFFELLEKERNLGVGFEFISFYTRENLKDEQERFLKKIKKYY